MFNVKLSILGPSGGLRPRLKQGEGGGRAAVLASHGSRHGWHRVKFGGGSGACFACAAWLALAGDGGVLGVVRWQGMSLRQWWHVGGAMAFSHYWPQHVGV